MIVINNKQAQITGTLKEITLDFTQLLMTLKATLVKEYGATETDAINMMNKCAEIAFMSCDKRGEYLKELQDE